MTDLAMLPPEKRRQKLTSADHFQYDWECRKWTQDFEIEDVWRFPVVLQAHHSLAEFRMVFETAMEDLQKGGIAGALFRFRIFLGRVFGWDHENKNVPWLKEGSLRARYAEANYLAPEDLLPPGSEDFQPVYVHEEESFAEIENATVHAGLHLGRVPLQDGTYTVNLTVYNKPKGRLGKFYMGLITPFRLWIIYPALLRIVGKAWQKHLS